MTQRSHWRGYPIVWDNKQWVFTDSNKPIPGYGGEVRPCKECGKVFTEDLVADPCIGVLPGVDNACCGHGIRDKSYIRFTNGVTVRGFYIDKI
jgi:hypothetical protein